MTPQDPNRLFLGISPGASDPEASDFVAVLETMYRGFATRRGWTVEVLDHEIVDGALRGVLLELSGAGCAADLAGEHGVHRRVRTPPAAGPRRHTAFAAVDVVPGVAAAAAEPLEEDDLTIHVLREGQGGSDAPETDSSPVRVTHAATGVSARCSAGATDENRVAASRVVRAKLVALAQPRRDADAAIGFAQQIRSYVMDPYEMVKDERSGVEVTDVPAVLAGDLDAFIDGFRGGAG